MTKVWIYTDTRYHVGHPDHLKVFADPESADQWFQANDAEGVAFGYDIIETEKADGPRGVTGRPEN
jgi:hypothetical protein